MTGLQWSLVVLAVLLVLYVLAVLALVLLGRRGDARALAGFIPDCLVLVRRLLADPRVRRGHRVLLALLAVYLALPVDLVPDVVPVAGQLDDAILVAVVLRAVLRGAGAPLLHEHWPGPARSLAVVERLLGGSGHGR